MFKKPFSFNGRIRRTEYSLSYLICFGCSLISFLIRIGVHGLIDSILTDNIFYELLFLPVYWFILAQGTKRCHDLGKSGWWQLIPFYTIWLVFVEGDSGDNRFGQDPKGLYIDDDLHNPPTIKS